MRAYNAKSPGNPRTWIYLPARFMISLAVVFQACDQSNSKDSPGETDSPRPGVPIQVSIETLNLQPFSEVLSLTGYVKSLEDVVVSTEEGGVLKVWNVRRGASVEQGDVLASMKDDVLRPQYEAALAQYEIADLTHRKQLKVFEDQGISELQVKTAQYSRDAAKAQMELARNRLERARIKSPIDGILDERFMDEGELAPPGAPVARVVNLDRTKVIVNVPESQAGMVKRGASVAIGISAFPDKTFDGRISFVGSAVITDNRTIQVEILVSNPERKLKPDMIARVQIESTGGRKAIVISEAVVSQIDPKTSVVYVETGGKAERRTVTTGGRTNGKVEIVSGLHPGDHLIANGYQNVFDGQLVEVLADTLSEGGQ